MDINNIMKSVELEKAFRDVSEEVDKTLFRTQALVTTLEIIYKDKQKKEDKAFVSDMQMTQAKLLKLVNKLNDIAMQAMIINEQSLYFACEDVKCQIADTMTMVRNLYM